MKVILCAVNAKYIHTNIAVRLIKGYCAARINTDISICEYTINNYAEDIIQDLFTRSPDVLCFSCYIWNIEMIKKISTMIRIVMPDIKIVFGGPEVSYNPAEVLENIPACDYIICGEGEETSAQLFNAIENGKNAENIRGVAYRNENREVTVNSPASPLDMADLPFPYEDFSETENKICYYEASRGCPFRCQYCLSSIEKSVRFAPLDKVQRELQIFIDHKVRQVKFVDRTFNANNKFAIGIVQYLIDNDNGITNFHFEVAAETLSDELLSLLKTARKGLFQLEIGVQSTNNETMKAISRNGAFDRICYVTDEIKKAGNIHVHLDLIAGLPHEDLSSFRKSFNDVHSLYPHQFQLGFLKVLHGSGMEKMCEEHNIHYSPYSPYEVLYTKYLSYSDILYLRHIEELVEMYYNSGHFINSLMYLINHSNTPFDMYSTLAARRSDIFTENISHNKNDTYRFLINAVNDFDNADPDLFRWIVKLDYIIHEKPKGNPDWTEPVMNRLKKDEIYDLTVRRNVFRTKFENLSETNSKNLINVTHIEKMPYNPLTGFPEEVLIYINYTERDTFGNAVYAIEKL